MFSRMLLAVDRSESAEVAALFAAGLATQCGSSVRVVHVNELLVGGRGYAAETEQEAMDVVDRAVATLTGAGVPADGVHHLANCFTVADRIAEAAQGWGADVIVLGSHRRRWLPRVGGSGIRERLTALTGLPTLTAPAPLRIGTRMRTRDLGPVVSRSATVQSIVS
jgi:nucleotide-binding universal stress UspA family protein